MTTKKNKLSSLGGRASMQKKTKKERSAFGKLGATARWAKYHAEKKAHEEKLRLRRERDRARRAGK